MTKDGPLGIATASHSADLHLPVRPGQDAALFAGLIRIVPDERLADDAFCTRFTTSLDRLRSAVEPFTPDHAAGTRPFDTDAAQILTCWLG